MRKLLKRSAGTAGEASARTAAEFDRIEAVLQAYETALNASDTAAVTGLFTADGVFMPQHSPSVIGIAAITSAYASLFQAMTFDVALQVEEIVQVAPDWAFVRTNSAGFVSLAAVGERIPDANHELFIFRKGGDGAWKIARYCFSTTNPPRP